MNRPTLAIAALLMLATTPLLAADAAPWPWKSKTPLDPALVVLSTVTALTASIDKSIVTIAVKAQAPKAGYSELQLTPRMGDQKDLIFAFDARGRAPQTGPDVMTDVAIDASYDGAPIGKFDVIEVYSKSNCMGYSVKDNKPVECSGKPAVE